MRIGGVRRLLIPAAEAYAGNPPQGSGIEANADLVFDITLHSVTP
jgi:FKBP-type peptidyl-prolyl cis-trans isomerase